MADCGRVIQGRGMGFKTTIAVYAIKQVMKPLTTC